MLVNQRNGIITKLILFFISLIILPIHACFSRMNTTNCSNELWVLTEKTNSDGMNLQAEIIAERIETAYPGVTVILDILPTEEDQRELKLTQLRSQIMSGNGPDVYLMPTGSELISDEPERDGNIKIDPLFPDVQLAMRNGVFLDILQYYLEDSQQQNWSLNQKIMDAGIYDGKQYVLPLRYDIPVIYTNPDLCTECGLPDELFHSDFFTIAESVLSSDSASEAAIGLQFPNEIEVLGELVSYSNGEILLSEQTLRDYLNLHQRRNLIAGASTQTFYETWDYLRRPYHYHKGIYEEDMWSYYRENAWPKEGAFHHECFNLLTEYTFQNYHWLSCGLPLYTGYLSGVLETIGVSRITGQDVAVYPLRSADGKIQASIAYWGAIGCSCEKPDLAYAFLRQFFDEEFQGDSYRPRVDRDGPAWTWVPEPQAMGLVEDSLPVRVNDCIPLLWNNLQYQTKVAVNTSIRETLVKVQKIQKETVTATDIPGLDWNIDHVYFPIALEGESALTYAMDLLNKKEEAPVGANIDELAKDIRQNLWWHLAEG